MARPLRTVDEKESLGDRVQHCHIPSAAEVATVELLVAHDLLSSQIFTRKVGSVIASSLPKLVSAAALAAPGVI